MSRGAQESAGSEAATVQDFFDCADPEVWVPVPLQFTGEPWASAREWAEWFASAASEGREGAEALRVALIDQCLLLASYPADEVLARYWHYPVNDAPGGCVDVWVAPRAAEGAVPGAATDDVPGAATGDTPAAAAGAAPSNAPGDAVALLPPLGELPLTPVVTHPEIAEFDSVARRLTLREVPTDGVGAATLAYGEWRGVVGEWVCYAVSFDANAEVLAARLTDIDGLCAAVGATLRAQLETAGALT